MKNFHQLLSSYGTISEEDALNFYSYFKHKQFKKNTILLEKESVSFEAFFVLKGALRQYFYTEKGTERTCNFSFENEFSTDLESFSKKCKSSTSIICLEETECMVISCDDLMLCLQKFPAIATYFNNLVETITLQNIKKIQSLLSKTPEEQFEEILEKMPKLLQRVPQRYIAQYIGVEPESLSRIRKRSLNTLKS
ncbi:Cyclic nucleotide-binding domain [Chryseobacterium nakagawai]|uniref:Crp/Fnr family transcriptional regulator n=1 Tax=Chryseobacterium nakagawai TaxID=1241982 RepID=A0AAD0YJ85_CHRNA|nr:Crp/Fnr family transcriptional regulator [Chryseobacterium nakagawai]AZA90055.1 Crp/Fnr family transcriptional regulator [Chryseobacterium nakagawai]VEH21498.1 Cyclic nucleotide-binding domain [Chryseobacterium nakagawai]